MPFRLSFLFHNVFLFAVGPSVESTDVSKVDEALLFEVEADVYWCLTKLLDNIQVGKTGFLGMKSCMGMKFSKNGIMVHTIFGAMRQPEVKLVTLNGNSMNKRAEDSYLRLALACGS